MGFFDALMNGLPSNPVRRQREATATGTEQQNRQSAEKFDMDLFNHMEQIGALPVVGGMVKSPMYDTSAPADMPDQVITRQADKKRVLTHKAADGQTVQFEVPDEQTQQRRGLYKHMQDVMGPVQTQVRDAENQNEGAAQAAKYRGIETGKNDADQVNREAIGLDVPSELEKVLPGISTGSNGKRRKVLPSELDDLTRSAGQFANYTSEAEARKNPQKKVAKTELSRDDAGKQTQIVTYTDGTMEEQPVNARGVTAKGAGAGLTTMQQHTVAREDENDIHNRAMVWQNKIDKFEGDQSELAKENVAHGQEMTEIGTQLANDELKGKDRAQAIRRKNLLQSLIDGNNEKFKTIEGQKKSALKIKDSIRAANGNPVAQEQAKANAPPKTATIGQVNKYAKQYGLDLAAAQKAFEDQGITIAK